MLHRFVDNVLAVTKESVKTFTYESLNIIARFINGLSALLLAILPGKSSILEGIHGWELRPTFRGPRLPHWMENGVSSFNQFIHELADDSDVSLAEDYASGVDDNEEFMLPGTPRSQASQLSHASSFHRYDRRLVRLTKYLFSWILRPLTFFMSLPVLFCHSVGFKRYGASQENHLMEHQSADLHLKKPNSIKHDIVHRTIDRRRGVIEDLHLAIEIFIEAIFDMVHKSAHFLLSPSEACQMLSRVFCSSEENHTGEFSDGEPGIPIPAVTMGENDPIPSERQATFCQSLNTDGRTCEDVIREHGYPYEAIRVVTSDGYVLLLERIPRHDSRKVVYLQHGILDSSLGWVSNGVVGSPAFAAFDQGFDVFLGNLRGLVSREHIDRNISSGRYWRYSVNEHGTQDAPAIIKKIHEVKTSELENAYQPDQNDEKMTEQPYRICAVCHSLGGAAMLMYVVTCRIEEKPHRLSRLILLSPAGFHEDSTIAFTLAEYFLLSFGPIIAFFIPGLYIPTRFFRMLLNKLARDFHNYPALGGLVQTLMSYIVGGDTSNWVGVLGLTHYNMYDMPGVSTRVAMHLAQMMHTRKFIMYDYGSAAANMEAYGSPWPLDLGQHYNLIDIPVDLVAGKRDQVIRPSMVKKHYRLMRKAEVEVSFNEFEYAHLDFTFSHREELLAYVMSRVLMVVPPQKHGYRPSVTQRKTKRNRSRNGGNHLEHRATDETGTC